MDVQQIVKKLKMQPHPEGGYYVETYRSKETWEGNQIISVIYFLLAPNQVSYWHQIKQDEFWFHHQGAPLEVHCINEKGEANILPLGPIGLDDCQPQQLVRAGEIFGSKMKGDSGYALVSCVVAPAFRFDDFKLFEREELIKMFPHLIDQIDLLK